MRKILLTAALVNGAALALALTACRAPDGAEGSRAGARPAAPNAAPATPAAEQAPPKAPADVVRRVTPNELRGMMERGEAVAVDVRGKEDYDRDHIKGALLMPRGELSARASELPKDKLIVFYCA